MLSVHYEVYAWDLSVRTAHLDTTRLFQRHERLPRGGGAYRSTCVVTIERPEGDCGRDWKLVTALPPEHGHPGQACRFGRFRARTTTSSSTTRSRWAVHAGTLRGRGRAARHRLTGRHDCDLERLCADLRRVRMADRALRHAGAGGLLRLPDHGGGRGYGGLEHRASTALICSRAELPWKGHGGLPDGCKLPRPVQPRYFHLERQAHQAGGVHPTISRARTTPGCCGPSRASPRITTTSPWCAAA